MKYILEELKHLTIIDSTHYSINLCSAALWTNFKNLNLEAVRTNENS